MNRSLAAALAAALALSSIAHAQQVYKWVDAEGRVHYGESPPKGVRAKPVDTTPQGVIEDFATCRGGKCAEAPSAPPAAATTPAPPPPPTAAPREIRGMSFAVYAKIRKGMGEGEVLQLAGEPDLQSVEGSEETSVGMRGFDTRRDRATGSTTGGGVGVRNTATFVVKTYTYLPTTSDPFTTVITFRGGRVTEVERIRKL